MTGRIKPESIEIKAKGESDNILTRNARQRMKGVKGSQKERR